MHCIYFSFWRHQFDFAQLREAIERHDISVYALYRQSIQDTVISQIVADRIGYLDGPPPQFPTQWELTNQIQVVNSYYNWFDKMCTELDDLIIRTVTYESLTGNGVQDLLPFDIATDQVMIHHQKVVNESVRQDIIAQTGLNITATYERNT
jgi:hypothetical protein